VPQLSAADNYNSRENAECHAAALLCRRPAAYGEVTEQAVEDPVLPMCITGDICETLLIELCNLPESEIVLRPNL